MRVPRKVVCGYWKNEEAQKKIAVWARVAVGVADSRNVRCLMFGMNMNNVAVTDGDRVEFEQRLGYHVDYYPVSSLMDYFKKVTDAEADALVEEYKNEYTIKIDESGEEVYWEKVKNAAKAEIALRRVLKDEAAQKQIAVWARVAAGVADAKQVRCLMFGMNMNNVAVTDGDRVEFEQRLGYHVDYYPVSSLMEYFKKVTDAETDALVEEYKKLYTVKIDETGEKVYWEKVRNSAKAEIALRRVLKDEGATAFTTNFDDLGDADVDAPDFCGFDQIPGLASQRLMEEGYGFGAEGDWKTACLYRTCWVMSQGLPKGCSFLEDYTLNFAGDRSSCLQSHMLEICPMIAVDKPKLEVHFLGIGIRKQPTARLVFTSKTGFGIKATVVDLGNRFRLIAQDVECIEPKPMPKLPVASALWVPQPTFEVGAGAWILAGGTHHSAFSYDLTADYWDDFAEMTGIEFVHISKKTTIPEFKKELRMNEVYYMLNKALK
jgi:L-arabinose isomerase